LVGSRWSFAQRRKTLYLKARVKAMAGTAARGRTVWWMLAALCLAALSYLSFGFFVHTYCENRPIMLLLAAFGVATLYFLIRFWPPALLPGVGSILAILLCLCEITFNVWFFVWATRICAEQRELH
jgi:hypothetical protein